MTSVFSYFWYLIVILITILKIRCTAQSLVLRIPTDRESYILELVTIIVQNQFYFISQPYHLKKNYHLWLLGDWKLPWTQIHLGTFLKSALLCRESRSKQTIQMEPCQSLMLLKVPTTSDSPPRLRRLEEPLRLEIYKFPSEVFPLCVLHTCVAHPAEWFSSCRARPYCTTLPARARVCVCTRTCARYCLCGRTIPSAELYCTAVFRGCRETPSGGDRGNL